MEWPETIIMYFDGLSLLFVHFQLCLEDHSSIFQLLLFSTISFRKSFCGYKHVGKFLTVFSLTFINLMYISESLIKYCYVSMYVLLVHNNKFVHDDILHKPQI